MKVTICIGSSCHIKGSHFVVNRIKELVKENNLSDKVELAGEFCMGKCQDGVCVTVDGSIYSVTPDTTDDFFNEKIKNAL